jgi:O-antigen biosynthesis protein WbqP
MPVRNREVCLWIKAVTEEAGAGIFSQTGCENMKREFDIFVSLFALVVFSPAFLVCALAVKLTSKGPVFHISDRIGANNSHFDMLKFRTMRTDAPQVATHLLSDPKAFLTPIGGFLRKTSLDELPQLINVLKGEMSIIGPRPALFNQDDQIALRTESGAHVLTPGITGWAQIKGRDDIPIARKVELDTWYLHNRSFWLDMKILWLTFWNVIRSKGVHH